MRATRLTWPGGVLIVCSLLTTLLVPPPADANEKPPGYITGTVTDSETGKPLPFANVVFFRMSYKDRDGESVGGAMAGENGVFTGRAQPGLYRVKFSYISYGPYEQDMIRVNSGDTVSVSAALTMTSFGVEKVVVKGEPIRTAQGSMITKLRGENTVSEAITSDQISKTTDSDAAEALQRVTGVSLVQGKYVYVRGLGERYSSTQINGASVGTPEPNRRVMPLDIFPTGVLDNVVVQKTYTPDMEGEFAGSVISLNTKEFAGNKFTQSLSLGRTVNPTDLGYMTYQGGALDFLGFDDGTRALPDAVTNTDKSITPANFSQEELAEIGKEFNNVWTPQSQNSVPNFSYSGVMSRGLSLFDKETGWLVSLSLSNSFDTRAKEDNVYTGSRSLSPLRLYNVNEARRTMLGAITSNLTMKLGDTNKMRLNLLYTRSAEDISRISQGLNDDRGSTVRYTDLAYVERGLFSGVLLGDHQVGFMGSAIDWNLGVSVADRNEPDRRSSAYEDRRGNGSFEATGVGSQHPMTRIYGSSNDKAVSSKVNWTIPVFPRGQEGSVKAGASIRFDDRSSEYRRFGFTARFTSNQVDRSQLPEYLLGPASLEDNTWTVEELTRANDSYTASQTVGALYAMYDGAVSEKLRINFGARYETSSQDVEARSPFTIDEDPGTQVHLDTDAILPALNVTVLPSKKTNLRLGYSKTLNRPELRELSPFNMFDFETGYQETGDTSLVTARIQNLDTRFEFYPGAGEFMALGVFYKDFDRPIQKFVAPTVGNYALRPQNGGNSYLMGWEAEMRLSFVSLWNAFDWMLELGAAPLFTRHFSLTANYGQVNSEVELYNTAGDLVKEPFQGQSEYSANLGVFYGSRRWESSLLYKDFGPRLMAFGLGSLPPIYEYPIQSLDFAVSYHTSAATRLRFTVENILDQDIEFRQSDKITQKYSYGTKFALAFKYEALPSE